MSHCTIVEGRKKVFESKKGMKLTVLAYLCNHCFSLPTFWRLTLKGLPPPAVVIICLRDAISPHCGNGFCRHLVFWSRASILTCSMMVQGKILKAHHMVLVLKLSQRWPSHDPQANCASMVPPIWSVNWSQFLLPVNTWTWNSCWEHVGIAEFWAKSQSIYVQHLGTAPVSIWTDIYRQLFVYIQKKCVKEDWIVNVANPIEF